MKGKGEMEQQRMRWVDSATNSVDVNLSKLGDSEGQGSLVCGSPWSCSRTLLSD